MAEENGTGSFRITIRHVWEEQQEMKRLLQKLAENLPTVARKLEQHEEDTAQILKDHEDRIRQIESKMWKIFGAIALVAGAAPFLARLMP